MEWDPQVKLKFDQMIEKVPIFMRPIAQDKVSKESFELVQQDGRTKISERDMVNAFFKVTPFGFHGPMKNDMDLVGIDYKKFGYDQ